MGPAEYLVGKAGGGGGLLELDNYNMFFINLNSCIVVTTRSQDFYNYVGKGCSKIIYNNKSHLSDVRKCDLHLKGS